MTKTARATLRCGKRRSRARLPGIRSIGPGRPGWHLECSVMSMEELGESFDLHAGGEDLVFPHHENEIAQSESLTGKTFARFWFHVRFLLVEGEKMSKSLGNFYTLRDLVLKGHKPSSIRYLLTSVPYRNQLNFTFDGLKQAAVSVERLRNFRQRLTVGNFPAGSNPEMQALATETIDRMQSRARRRSQHRTSASRHLRNGAQRQFRARCGAIKTRRCCTAARRAGEV